MSHVAAGTVGQKRRPIERAGRGRRLMDSLVCLALAVILFRTFQVEGYMISTGSMAPTLLGFHKQVVCPSCRYSFAFGAAHDDGEESNGTAAVEVSPAESFAVCPNCGQSGIDLSHVPRNQGDQLLVHKHAFQFFGPRRWEVIVFRNPYKATQAYVKRIVGLPGETVEIRSGDVYVDGRIQRKPWASQRAVRIDVYDDRFTPEDDAWQDRWSPRPVAAEGAGQPTALFDLSREPLLPLSHAWRREGGVFVLEDAETIDGAAKRETAPRELSWVAYRHWIRWGGLHETLVALPADVPRLDGEYALLPLRYDDEAHTLSCTGVVSPTARDRLTAIVGDKRLAAAVEELSEQSHVAPVTDNYGYNRSRGGVPPAVVRDLMLSLKVTIAAGTGRFAVEMTDGVGRCRLELDAGSNSARLFVDGSAAGEAVLAEPLIGRALEVELSLFDRQVLAAIDGQPLFAPAMLPPISADVPGPRQPVRFGGTNIDARVGELRLYRDVYYTANAEGGPVTLGEDEFYVLGDNSPVSLDSRRWDDPAVPERLFLGKPFVVHLPSRQARVRIGNFQRYIRVPDFSRMRYIR